jgi:hypothetical protein
VTAGSHGEPSGMTECATNEGGEEPGYR